MMAPTSRGNLLAHLLGTILDEHHTMQVGERPLLNLSTYLTNTEAPSGGRMATFWWCVKGSTSKDDVLYLTPPAPFGLCVHTCVQVAEGAHSRVGSQVELIALLECVPPLLDACVVGDDDNHTLQRLRLVSKDASRVALLGLKTYSLELRGCPGDTNVSGSNLLRGAKLQTLEVDLSLSGGF